MTLFNTHALNELNFSEVVEKYSTITHKGANDFTFCPWHDDKHPSLLIGGSNHPHRCKCFACGKGGSVIDYVMAKNNWDFKEACSSLQKEFNIDPLPQTPLPSVGNGDCLPFVKPKPHLVASVNTSVARGEWVTGGNSTRKGREKRMSVKEIMEKERMIRERNEEMKEVSYFPLEYIEKHKSSDSTFCDCLRALFIEQGIQYAVESYRLGSYAMGERKGFVMFPSIDAEGRCHNVKIQRYCTDRSSPQFFHKEEKSTYWLASILQKRGKLPAEAKYDSGCFFGEHLLTERPGDVVVLVESPKNAIIGFLDNPMYVWIAVGNKSNLTRKRLECLRGRKVIVIPDKDAVEEWARILEGMKDIATFTLSSFCEMGMKELGDKGDVADYLIEKLKV